MGKPQGREKWCHFWRPPGSRFVRATVVRLLLATLLVELDYKLDDWFIDLLMHDWWYIDDDDDDDDDDDLHKSVAMKQAYNLHSTKYLATKAKVPQGIFS